jgi:hypothetical protein
LLLWLLLAGCDECAGENRQQNRGAGDADHYAPFLIAWDILPRWGRFGFGGGVFSSDGAREVGARHFVPVEFASRAGEASLA